MRRKSKIRPIRNTRTFDGYFEEVYAEYFKPLYLYARSLAKSDEVAKDVVSDVFFNLWKSKSDLKNIQQLKSYLFCSVKNQVIRTLSDDPKSFNNIDREGHFKHIENINPEEILLEKELVLIIKKSVESLPDQCRLIFDLAKNKQLSYAEIAGELGISQSTIKTQVARALVVVRKAIEEQYDNKRGEYWRHYGISS